MGKNMHFSEIGSPEGLGVGHGSVWAMLRVV